MIRTTIDLRELDGAITVAVDVNLPDLDAAAMRFVEALLDACRWAPSMIDRGWRESAFPEVPAPSVAVEPVDEAGEGGEAVTPEPEAPPAPATGAVPPAPRPEFPPVERTWETHTAPPVRAKPGRKPKATTVEVNGMRLDPTTGKVRHLLDTLAEAGGEFSDSDGLAGVLLGERAGLVPATARNFLTWLDRGGYIERDVRSKKTYRIALTDKGREIVGAGGFLPAAIYVPEAYPATVTPIREPVTCILCGDAFLSRPALHLHEKAAHGRGA